MARKLGRHLKTIFSFENIYKITSIEMSAEMKVSHAPSQQETFIFSSDVNWKTLDISQALSADAGIQNIFKTTRNKRIGSLQNSRILHAGLLWPPKQKEARLECVRKHMKINAKYILFTDGQPRSHALPQSAKRRVVMFGATSWETGWLVQLKYQKLWILQLSHTVTLLETTYLTG